MHGRVPCPRLRAGAANFLLLARGYWAGVTAPLAWLLTALVAVLLLLSVLVQSRINTWNAAFFNALEQRQASQLAALMWDFAFYVAAAGIIMVGLILFRMALQVSLRKWLTQRAMGRWLADQTYLRLIRRTRGSETPEFRLADDIRLAVDPLVDLSVGLAGSLLIAVTFFAVLASVGGSLEITALGITLPAYFLFGAVAYALVMSGIASLAGWPLIRRIEHKNHREGMFRYELTRFRESAAKSAPPTDHDGAREVLTLALEELARSWRGVVVGQARVSGVASANAVLVGVFPVILAVPKYIAGDMTLGAVMQLATAFIQVQMALNWIVDNFFRFAEWRASANRVGDFLAAMEIVSDGHIAGGFESPSLSTMDGMIGHPVGEPTVEPSEAPLAPGLSPTP
jgi:putative ATP-binding cassette transporter